MSDNSNPIKKPKKAERGSKKTEEEGSKEEMKVVKIEGEMQIGNENKETVEEDKVSVNVNKEEQKDFTSKEGKEEVIESGKTLKWTGENIHTRPLPPWVIIPIHD